MLLQGGAGRGRGGYRPPAAPAHAPLSAEVQGRLAEALQDEAVMTEKQNGVIEILQNANELHADADGEVELDLR